MSVYKRTTVNSLLRLLEIYTNSGVLKESIQIMNEMLELCNDYDDDPQRVRKCFAAITLNIIIIAR